MLELADKDLSKGFARKGVRVRIPLPARQSAFATKMSVVGGTMGSCTRKPRWITLYTYLGDRHITRGPRDVYVLAIACSDGWPGLMAAARQAMSAVILEALDVPIPATRVGI